MANEVDVELFRSLSLYNNCLMQLQGSGLLERLKILLSLYKGLLVLRAVEERQGHFWSSVSLCERLLVANVARRLGVILEGGCLFFSQNQRFNAKCIIFNHTNGTKKADAEIKYSPFEKVFTPLAVCLAANQSVGSYLYYHTIFDLLTTFIGV